MAPWRSYRTPLDCPAAWRRRGVHDGLGETGELFGAAAGAGTGTHQDHRDLLGASAYGLFETFADLCGGTSDGEQVDPSFGDQVVVLGLPQVALIVGCL